MAETVHERNFTGFESTLAARVPRFSFRSWWKVREVLYSIVLPLLAGTLLSVAYALIWPRQKARVHLPPALSDALLRALRTCLAICAVIAVIVTVAKLISSEPPLGSTIVFCSCALSFLAMTWVHRRLRSIG
jgi:hypothetical protein